MSRRNSDLVVKGGVALVALGAAIVNIVHVSAYAEKAGEHPGIGLLMAAVLEGAVAAGAAAILTSDRRAVAAWFLLILGLAGSMAGNVAAASTWPGRVGAVLLSLMLLVGVEVIAGRTRTPKASKSRTRTGTANGTGSTDAAVPGPDRTAAVPKPKAKPRTEPQSDELLVQRARNLNREHLAEHGKPISRDKLRTELKVGNTKATELVATVREGVA